MALLPLIGAIGSIASAWLGYDALAEGNQGKRRCDPVCGRSSAPEFHRCAVPASAVHLRRQYRSRNAAWSSRASRWYRLRHCAFPLPHVPGYEFTRGQGINAAQTRRGGWRSSVLRQDAEGPDALWHRPRRSGVRQLLRPAWWPVWGGRGGHGNLINVGTNTAGNLGSLATNDAANRGSSYVAGANAITGGIQNLADLASCYRRTGRGRITPPCATERSTDGRSCRSRQLRRRPHDPVRSGGPEAAHACRAWATCVAGRLSRRAGGRLCRRRNRPGLQLKQMNDADKARLVEQAASWAYGANDPQKWEAGRQQWAAQASTSACSSRAMR